MKLKSVKRYFVEAFGFSNDTEAVKKYNTAMIQAFADFINSDHSELIICNLMKFCGVSEPIHAKGDNALDYARREGRREVLDHIFNMCEILEEDHLRRLAASKRIKENP